MSRHLSTHSFRLPGHRATRFLGSSYFLSFVLFTILSLFVFWPIFLGKVNLNGNYLVSFWQIFDQNLAYKNTAVDQLRLYFPFVEQNLRAFANFSLPFWNPYAFSGHPQLANIQGFTFYPLNIFAFILPKFAYWHLLRITPTILASFFTFLYLRHFRLSKVSSIYGALIFGFSPFILTWGEEQVNTPHSIIWLPLILFSVEKFLKEGKGKYLAIVAASITFSVFAGFPQTTIYLLIFAFSYLVFRAEVLGIAKLKILQILGAFFIGIGLAAIQLVPSLELYANSLRSQVALTSTLKDFLLPPTSLLTFLSPDFFGNPATWNFFRGGRALYYEGILFVGISPLIFATFAFSFKKYRRFLMFFGIWAILAVAMTTNIPTSRWFLSLPIPILSTSIANRLLFILPFSFAVCGAFGLELWNSAKNRKILRFVGALGVAYALVFLFILFSKRLNLDYFGHGPGYAVISLRNLIIPFGVFIATSGLVILGQVFTKKKVFFGVLITILTFGHIFYFSQKYYSFTKKENVFPKTGAISYILENQGIYRTWGVENAIMENNFASYYHIFSPEGYASLNDKSYAEFTFRMQGNESSFTARADAGLGRGGVEQLDNEDRRKLLDLVGIKFLLAETKDSETVEKHNFKKVFEDGKTNVFENLSVMPRVFLASSWEGLPPIDNTEGSPNKKIEETRRSKIPQKLLSNDFDFRNVVVLEKPSSISAQFGEGKVDVISYRPQEVLVKTKSDQPKLLFLSDNYYPGWKAKVDGEEVEILRADYTFRAVPLLSGKHTIKFYYDPLSFKVGAVISLVSLMALLWLINPKFRYVKLK